MRGVAVNWRGCMTAPREPQGMAVSLGLGRECPQWDSLTMREDRLHKIHTTGQLSQKDVSKHALISGANTQPEQTEWQRYRLQTLWGA